MALHASEIESDFDARCLALDVRHSFIGSIEHNSHSGLMWNLALDGNGSPTLPGSNSCGTPCRPVVTVNSDGSWSVNQECASSFLHYSPVFPQRSVSLRCLSLFKRD